MILIGLSLGRLRPSALQPITAGRNSHFRRRMQHKTRFRLRKRRLITQHKARQPPKQPPHLIQPFPRLIQLEAEPIMHILIKMLDQQMPGFIQAGGNVRLQLALQGRKSPINLSGSPARLINRQNALLKIQATVHAAQDLIGRAKHTIKQLELVRQQFQHPLIGMVAGIDEVDHHHIMLLPVAMTTANPLLNALRVPGQIVVDDQRTELQIDPFRRRLGSDHHISRFTEVINQRSTSINGAGTDHAVAPGMTRQPVLINRRGRRIGIHAVERHQAFRETMSGQELPQIRLGAP